MSPHDGARPPAVGMFEVRLEKGGTHGELRPEVWDILNNPSSFANPVFFMTRFADRLHGEHFTAKRPIPLSPALKGRKTSRASITREIAAAGKAELPACCFRAD